MSAAKRKLSAEEEALDRLVIEATSEQSLQPDKSSGYDADASERMWHKRWLLQFGLGVGVLVIIVGGIVFYIVRGHMEETAQEERVVTLVAEHDARLAAVAEETKAEVEEALSQNKFEEARMALRKGDAKEMPPDVRTDLDTKIIKSVRTYREKLLDRIETKLEKEDMEAVEKMLEDVRTLDGFGPPGDRRFSIEDKFHEKAGEIAKREKEQAREDELAKQKEMLVLARQALHSGNWDEARRLLEDVRQNGRIYAECDHLDKELRETIGGRLMVESNVANALVVVAGKEAVRVGSVVAGLPPGEIEFVVQAEGYVPASGQAHVRYPDVIKKLVKLIPEAPGPLWAINALEGHCAQRLAADYYLQKAKKASWRDAVDKMAEPCCKKRKKKQSKKELAAMMEKAIEKYLDHRKNEPIRSLNDLGEFTAKYPKSLKRILGNKKCSKALRSVLDQIENGCADCAGQGRQLCAGCEGKGKRRELRSCDACNATGQRTCPACKGTGDVKCKKCKGTGTITMKRRDSGTFDKRETKQCPTCHGSGKQDCRKCEGGRLRCTKCKGTGRGEFPGPCSECGGTGDKPCATCGETGSRKKMDLDKRRELEEDLAGMIDDGTAKAPVP